MRPYIVLCALLLIGSAAWGSPFPDLPPGTAREAVGYLTSQGILSGYPDGTFGPQRSVSRAELATLMMRRLGVSGESGTCFSDVAESAWFSGHLCAAKRRGVIGSDSNNTFRPHDNATYAEALKIILSASAFTIEATSDDWRAPYIAFANQNGILARGTYDPNAAITRVAMAETLYATIQLEAAWQAGTQMALDLPPATITLVAMQAAAPAVAAPTPEPVAAVPALNLSNATAARVSPGCGRAAPASPLTSLAIGGSERSLIASVPRTYAPNTPHQLVVAFHGRTSSNSEVKSYFDLEKHAQNTIFLYPAGIRRGSGFTWSDASDHSSNLRDYALFDALLERYSNDYCLDLEQVYVVGHSLGAWFANSLSCARGDKIRAAATLGGGVSPSTCQGSVAAMVLHNPNDNAVPISQGVQARDMYLTLNGLGGNGSEPIMPASLNCRRYGNSSSSYPVVWCPHTQDVIYGRYNPHSWPRETGQTIMTFFAALPEAQPAQVRDTWLSGN